jgi:hypothetical protein
MELGTEDNKFDMKSEERSSKRMKVDDNTGIELQPITKEVEYLIGRLNATWDYNCQ